MGSRKAAVIIISAVIIIALGFSVYAIKSRTKVKASASPQAKLEPIVAEHTGLASTQDYDKLAAEDAKVKPSVPDYELKPGLSNVANLKIFKDILDSKSISMIEKNKFVVTPTDYVQMFHVYENNEYQRPDKIPAFITTDSMLHTYHIFYDYTLRQVESYKLFDAAVELTDAMMAVASKDYFAATDKSVKEAAKRNVAYFAVARFLLKGTPAPKEVEEMVSSDLKKIAAHEGRANSAIIGVKMDFSQFVPRGHYTRTEKLKKYFRTMMWYGLSPFPIPEAKQSLMPTKQALLMVHELQNAKVDGKSALAYWDMIYEPTAFYVGTADDYTVYQYSDIMDQVYGKRPKLNDFGDDKKLKMFVSLVKKLPGPGIDNGGGQQYRFMGQRFIADSRILQELTHPKVRWRAFPSGMDIFAAMGSDRALELLESDSYNADDYDGFEKQMTEMRKEIANTTQKTWQSNLYWGWLWTLRSLTKPTEDGCPAFMRSNAWLDKTLLTGLGSWTELRHDTILYAKQSVAECGGDSDEPKTPKGYVEPNLDFWTKLYWLNNYTRKGLESRGLLNAELKDKFDKLGDWLAFCRKITVKELTQQKVTEEEYQQMCCYGAELESLMLSFAGGDLLSDADKDMALVADVHTVPSAGKVLEEATGRAAAIYVVVPIEGKLYLTRGAVYTHYEFKWPMSDRLTDEKWQKMLNSGQTPPSALWLKEIISPDAKKPPMEFEEFFGGC